MAREEQVIKIRIETGQAKTATAGINKDLQGVQKTGAKTGSSLGTAFKGIKSSILGAIPALRAFSAALVSTGVGALVVAVGLLVNGLITAGRKGAEFGKALSGLKAVSGASAEEVTRLSNQAKELGSTTAFTASQVVELQTELAKLGFTIQDIENSTPAILDLAAALEVDLGEAAEFAGSVVRSFGLTTDETQRVVDVMSLSTARSALNFNALQESLKIVAPTARAVGVSVERTTALLGALADTGLKGSIAGTGLSKTFIELNKKGLTLDQAFDKVRGSSNQLNTAVELVGVVGAKSLLNLANAGEKIENLEDTFNNAAGAAKEIAETRLDNLAGDTTKLSSAWEGFLLGIEDGSGSLNEIARFGVQTLTKAIGVLGEVVEFVSFYFVEYWTIAKSNFTATVDIFKGLFKVFGGAISIFANKALLAISEIPLIGKAVDKDAAKKRIEDANKLLLEGAEDLERGVKAQRDNALRAATFFSRYKAQQEGKAERLEKIKQAKATEEQQKTIDAEAEKRREEAAKQREEDLKKLAKIEEKIQKQREDFEDQTELAKAQRKRERALKEIEDLKLTEEEKRKAVAEVNAYYDEIEAVAKGADELNAETARQKAIEDAKKQAEEERKIELQKRAEKQKTLDNAIALAGAESGIGRALLVAKQLLHAKNLVLDAKESLSKAKKTVANATLDGASSASAVAAGTAKTASIGFPQNIPMLIGYAAQAVGIISAIKQATSKAKSVASGLGGAGGGGDISAPRVPTASAAQPAFNIVGASAENQLAQTIAGKQNQPIKAFVTSQDVTTAQSLDRNIVEAASIGG